MTAQVVFKYVQYNHTTVESDLKSYKVFDGEEICFCFYGFFYLFCY